MWDNEKIKASRRNIIALDKFSYGYLVISGEELEVLLSACVVCAVAADSGYRQWLQTVATDSGCIQWLQTVATDSGYRQWLQTVAADSGCRQWLQTVATDSGCRQWLQTVATDSGYRHTHRTLRRVRKSVRIQQIVSKKRICKILRAG
jgi:hypothetical protein